MIITKELYDEYRGSLSVGKEQRFGEERIILMSSKIFYSAAFVGQ